MKFYHYFWDWNDTLKCMSFLPQNKIAPKKAIAIFAFFLFVALININSINAATFTVTTNLDNESNGCLIGQCTLREAITSANALPDSDTINFGAGVTGTIILNGNHLSITNDITINGPGARTLTVSGNNASRVFIVRGSGTTANISGLTISDGSAQPILIAGITISDGGGILNTNGATLNLTEVTVSDNEATTFGGGISTRAIVLTTTTTNITRSTISGNNALLGGGGISNLGTVLISSAQTTITNSTISNNNTAAEGGGISNTLGNLNLTNNTISDNQSVAVGGGIVNVVIAPLGTVNMRNNIIARNSAVVGTDLISSDVLGTFNSLGNNLIGNNLNAEASFAASVIVNGTHTPNAQADLVGSVDVGFEIIYPLLGNLQNNGGSTNTRLPLVGSPALDNGNNCVTDSSCPSNNPPTSLTNEQRGTGFARIANSIVDIGATEGPAAPNLPYVVNTLLDNEADGCGVNNCTLREAINAANAAPDFDTINFQTGLNGTINLTNGQLVVSSNLTINGLGARNLTVDGNSTNRVFLIATPVLGGDIEVEINDLTVSNGRALPVTGLAGDGGGILNGALLGIISGKSTLILYRVNVSNNLATTLGGGIATRLGSETIINNSLISENTSNAVPFVPGGDVGGGGISNAALSTTVVVNTTVTNNTSLAAGGGVLNAAGQMHLTNNTITHNESTLVGGGVVSLLGVATPLGVVNLRNTVIAQNQAGLGIGLFSSDVLGVAGSFNSLGNNLIGNNVDATVDFQASVFVGGNPEPNAEVDLVGSVSVNTQIIDPLLDILQDNGGPTDSRFPLEGSPLRNAGNNCVNTNTCTENPAGRNPHRVLIFDQRSGVMPRRVSTNTEIGAIEVPLEPTSSSVSVGGRVVNSNGRGIYRVAVKLTDSTGRVYTSFTNQFGNYRFNEISVGEVVIVSPQHRFYVFSQEIIWISEDVHDLDFTIAPIIQERKRKITKH